MKNILFILSLLSIAFILGCAENDGNVGGAVSDPGFTGEVIDSLFYPAVYDTFYLEHVNTGGAQRLYLGAHGGFQAKFLLKFTNFSSLPDSFQLDSAKIRLRTASFFGDTTAVYPDFDFSVHEVLEVIPNSDWFETNVTFWDSVITDPAVIFDSTISQSPDSDSLTFVIPTDIVEQWIFAELPVDTTIGDTASVTNTGLIFEYSGSPEFAREFFSSEMADTTLKPQLILSITTSDSLWLDSLEIEPVGGDTSLALISYATSDVFLARDTIQLANNRLYLGRAAAYRCLYYFDTLELFPSFGTNIHKAEFTIFVDKNHPLAVGGFVTCKPTRMSDGLWMTDPTQANYTFSPTDYSTSVSDSMVLDITYYMQNYWVAHPDSNFGFMVRFSNENAAMARLPVFTWEDPDPSKRPYVHVIYSRGEQ